jgi:hypothetical protein
MNWSPAPKVMAIPVLAVAAVLVLGCASQFPLFSGDDYSGAIDSTLIDGFLEQGIINTEGVNIEYKPELGDTYTASIKSCSGDRCVVNLNLTVYYMSFYNKFFVMELDSDYDSGSWSITGYDILFETNVRRDI